MIVNRGCLIISLSSLEQEENEKLFEDFPVVNNSTEFLYKLFRQDKEVENIIEN
ncbi:MAG: hypothetical protein WC770_01315 [Phycisphaerae bacterium]